MSSPTPPMPPPKEERQWIGLNELPYGASIPDAAKLPAPAQPPSGDSEGDGTVNPKPWHIVGRRLASVFQEADPECYLPESKTTTSASPKRTVMARPAWE